MAKSKVTEQMFTAVKRLTQGGATIQECGSILGISHATVSRIRASKTFEDFTQIHKKEPAPEKHMADKNPAASNYQIYQITQLLKEQNETLKLISSKVAFIVDELCGVKPNAEQDH